LREASFTETILTHYGLYRLFIIARCCGPLKIWTHGANLPGPANRSDGSWREVRVDG
jgi:hypothetical protein